MAAAARTSRPQVGCATRATRRALQELAADHELLEIAAGEGARVRVLSAAAHVVSVDAAPGERRDRPGRSQPRRTRPWWHAVRSAFLASDMPGTAARPRRSSGTCTRPRAPRARALRGGLPARRRCAPHRPMRPASRRRAPRAERSARSRRFRRCRVSRRLPPRNAGPEAPRRPRRPARGPASPPPRRSRGR